MCVCVFMVIILYKTPANKKEIYIYFYYYKNTISQFLMGLYCIGSFVNCLKNVDCVLANFFNNSIYT